MRVLLQIILKEREGKKGKPSAEQESSGQEEPEEENLQFTDDLEPEPASQEGKGSLTLRRVIVSSGAAGVIPCR